MRREVQARAEHYKAKQGKAVAQLAEVQEVLKLAAEADSRKEALLEEVRASARQARERAEAERDALGNEREELARERE